MPKDKKSENTSVNVLLDSSRDAHVLLILWYLKRTFVPLLLLGFIGSMLATDVGNNEIDYTNPESVFSELLSPLASLAFAVFIKVIVNILAAIASYPVVRERVKNASGDYGYFFTRYIDMWQILKGVRSLRWTHHVRQEALKRVSFTFIREGKLDKAIDYITVFLVVLFVCTPMLLAL